MASQILIGFIVRRFSIDWLTKAESPNQEIYCSEGAYANVRRSVVIQFGCFHGSSLFKLIFSFIESYFCFSLRPSNTSDVSKWRISFSAMFLE